MVANMSRMKYVVLILMLVGFFACMSKRAVNKNALEQEQACVENIQKNDYDRARTNCQLCLDFDDSVPECYNGLGLVAYSDGKTEKAIDYFRKALSESSLFAQAKNNIGAIYFREGNFEKALPFFTSTMETDPGYEDGRYNLALTYLRLAQEDIGKQKIDDAKKLLSKAETNFKKLLAMHPNNANGYRDLGVIWTYRAQFQKLKSNADKDLAKAENYFQQCLEVKPQDEECHESYGHTLLIQNQFDQALYQFVQCLATNKNNSQCLKGMNTAYEGAKVKSKAIQTYMAMIKADPGNAEGHFGYCKALLNAGMNEMGASECKTAISLNSKLCDAYYSLGMYYKKSLNAPAAASNCRSYILCDSDEKEDKKVSQCKAVITAAAE